jgi:carboxyl-terminal processing protease
LSSGHRRGFGAGMVLGLLAGVAAAVLAGIIGGWLEFEEDGDPVTQARQVIEDNYFEPPSAKLLDDASINGMVRELRKRYDDKFSHYFTEDQLKIFNEQTSGQFAGVGLSVTEIPAGLRVSAVFPDTPAEEAGMKPGDVITAVDGKSIAGTSSEVSTSRIRGEIGTSVDLTIKPADGGKAQELTLERANVRIPAVDASMQRDPEGEKVGYVYFNTFSEGAHGELRQAIEDLYRKGAEGLVLDMRGNGGGLLNEAILSTSIFLEKGNVVSTRSRTQGDQDYAAVGDAIDPRPTVVLVNRDTASAAEILTAALKQNDLATVVGTRTYGKGVFQEVMHLPAGGALDLTVGQYLTSDGTSILGEGVKPDVRAADDPDTRNDGEPDTRGDDEALDRALAVLGEIVSEQDQ